MKTIAEISGATVLLLIGFKRVDFLKSRLIEIEKNFPVDVYISIDGPTSTVEAQLISEFLKSQSEARKDIKFRYRVCEENMGLAAHIVDSVNKMFLEYSYVILIEDDVLISDTFVESILCGFMEMEKDSSIAGVGGFSSFRKAQFYKSKNKWRKSKYFSAWGWGTNREQWSHYSLELPINYVDWLANSSSWDALSDYQKKLWLSRFDKTLEGAPFTWDYQMQYNYFKRSVHMLLPTQRFSDNEGFGDRLGTNTVGKRPRWMTKISVSSNIPRGKIKLFNGIYEQVDCITIGGDSRVFKSLSVFRTILAKINFINRFKSSKHAK